MKKSQSSDTSFPHAEIGPSVSMYCVYGEEVVVWSKAFISSYFN